jgi:putative DNA primase/helicase
MSDWKAQLRYFPCHSTEGRECACGEAACEKQGKHPAVTGWQRKATNDPEQVARWRTDPKINLAIACGHASNLFVLDVDGIFGPISVAELEKEHGPMPETFTVRTGNGKQLYFQYPSTPLPNSVKFVPDLDTRSEGGYVIAEGSRHKSGAVYTVIKDVPPAPMPEWLIRKILSSTNSRKNRGLVPAGGLQKGSRNNTIFKLAASLHHNGAHIETTTAACLAENQKASQPLPEGEVLTAVKSAYGYPTDEAPLDMTDQHLTDRFVESNPPLKYITDDQSWVAYMDGVWIGKQSPTLEIGEFIRSLEPNNIYDPKTAAAIHKRLNSKDAVHSVTFLAQARPPLGILADEFDPDPMLLGLPDGLALDLRSGEVRTARKEDLITHILPVVPDGCCERWEQYLEETHPNDPELIAYLQRLVGYWLTSDTREDMVAFFIGVGGSGKGTFAEPLQKLLGQYCIPIPIGMLLEDTNEDRRLNYIADLRGTRLAVCNEGSKMRRLDSRGIKMLTGGGWAVGRRMGQQAIRFKQTHKILILANDNPVLELDEAMMQRVHVVPFNQKFRDTDREQKGLREFFAEPEQLKGILAWAVKGCLIWQKDGLKPPASVTASTEQYFKDADFFEQFLQDETEEDPSFFESTESLYRVYVSWCNRNGYTDKFTIGSTTSFASTLKQKRAQLKYGRVGRQAGGRGFAGIRLLRNQVVKESEQTFDHTKEVQHEQLG